MKLIFLGTPYIALKSLEALSNNHQILCVVTASDKPVGRSGKLQPSEIAEKSVELGLNIIKPEKLDESVIEYLKSLNADYFVTFAYGKIFKPEFLNITNNGGINIHPSLLPEYRGPSPIQSAIADGKDKSGITIQKIALEVDSGDVLDVVNFDINSDDDSNSIEERVSELSAMQIINLLNKIENKTIVPVVQDSAKAVYCKKIEKSDGIIDWSLKSNEIFNKIRAYVKWPICSTLIDGKKLNILKAEIVELEGDFTPGTVVFSDKKNGIVVSCGDCNGLKIKKLQLQGKSILDAKDFMNGFRDLQGKVLG